MSLDIDDIVIGDHMDDFNIVDIEFGGDDAGDLGANVEDKVNEDFYSCNKKLEGFGSTAFSQDEIIRISKMLNKQVPLPQLKSRNITKTDLAYYLTGDEVIRKANEIFGVNGWSFKILKLVNDSTDESESETKISYTAVGRIVLKDGTSRENVGTGTYRYFGNSVVKLFDKAYTHGNAKKAAITDCLKRTLGTFGTALGLGLSSSSYQSNISIQNQMTTVVVPHIPPNNIITSTTLKLEPDSAITSSPGSPSTVTLNDPNQTSSISPTKTSTSNVRYSPYNQINNQNSNNNNSNNNNTMKLKITNKSNNNGNIAAAVVQ